MSDYPMLISNKLHSFRNFRYTIRYYHQTNFSKNVWVRVFYKCTSHNFLLRFVKSNTNNTNLNKKLESNRQFESGTI